jgi:hypothetical protein
MAPSFFKRCLKVDPIYGTLSRHSHLPGCCYTLMRDYLGTFNSGKRSGDLFMVEFDDPIQSLPF